MELDAGVACGDDKTATETRILDSIESALLAPPWDANDHAAAWPCEDGNAVSMFRLCKAECCGDLALARVEYQAGYLSVAVNRGEFGTRKRVEEVNTPVVASASSGDQRRLPGREGYRFAGGIQ